MDVTFPFFAAGLAVIKGRRRFCDAVTPDAGRTTPDGKRRLIRGGGTIARISYDFGPQDPADGDGMDMYVARGYDVPWGRITPLTEAPVPPVGTTVACTRLDYSDPYVPDCWALSAGARVPPVGTTVHCARLDCSDFCVPDCVPELLESVRDTEEILPVAGDVVLPEMSAVVFAGTAAVPVSLPAAAGVVPSAVFAGGGG